MVGAYRDMCRVSAGQVGAVRLFFTPEEGDNPQSHAKRHFLHTGESKDKTECIGFNL